MSAKDSRKLINIITVISTILMIRRPPRSTRAQYRRQRQMCIRDR